MPDLATVWTWQGRTLVDRDRGRIGTIDLDDHTGQPAWALVTTGLFATRSSFVPSPRPSSATTTSSSLRPAAGQRRPTIEADQHLSQAEARRRWRHYGLDDAATDHDLPRRRDASGRDPARRDAAGPTTDDAMTRSEEELRVGTTQRERGRAGLRRYVVTEPQQVTVPVRRERARVERQPITDANLPAATSGPELSEADQEVVLGEEEPVVQSGSCPKSGSGWTRTP